MFRGCPVFVSRNGASTRIARCSEMFLCSIHCLLVLRLKGGRFRSRGRHMKYEFGYLFRAL